MRLLFRFFLCTTCCGLALGLPIHTLAQDSASADSQQAAAQSFQVLGETSLSYPYPSRLLVWWLADHPPICDRVPFAANYDPWSRGQAPQFVK